MRQSDTYIVVEDVGQDSPRLVLRGDWIIDDSAAILAAIKAQKTTTFQEIDASSIERIDMWGALQLKALSEKSSSNVTLNDKQKKLFDFLPLEKTSIPSENDKSGLHQTFEKIGKGSLQTLNTAYGMLSFVGEVSVCFVRNIFNPRGFRFHSIVRHIEETGLRAIPIIALLAVLISMVISYQASTQLEKFGASIFTIDLTVISLLREMAVLVTAIMVAGRSGSAFAAEIGVMKLREEVDALKTMGFNPIELLVLPRLIAMLITLPLLAFIAAIAGLGGSAVISILMLDIPFGQYIDRVEMVAKPTMFFVGIVKAPVFAFLITIVGCYQGMNVSGSAESVGKLTTVAVVQSIFLVIMADAIFSIIFSSMGI